MSDHIPVSARIQFNDQNDIVVINGVPVHVEVLSALTTPSRPGLWFRVLSKDERGVVIIQSRQDPEVVP